MGLSRGVHLARFWLKLNENRDPSSEGGDREATSLLEQAASGACREDRDALEPGHSVGSGRRGAVIGSEARERRVERPADEDTEIAGSGNRVIGRPRASSWHRTSGRDADHRRPGLKVPDERDSIFFRDARGGGPGDCPRTANRLAARQRVGERAWRACCTGRSGCSRRANRARRAFRAPRPHMTDAALEDLSTLGLISLMPRCAGRIRARARALGSSRRPRWPTGARRRGRG